LVAAAGHQTLTGGGGADIFEFNLDNLKGSHNTATITDFDQKWISCNIPAMRTSNAYLTITAEHC